jgi:hypothetical protein
MSKWFSETLQAYIISATDPTSRGSINPSGKVMNKLDNKTDSPIHPQILMSRILPFPWRLLLWMWTAQICLQMKVGFGSFRLFSPAIKATLPHPPKNREIERDYYIPLAVEVFRSTGEE